MIDLNVILAGRRKILGGGILLLALLATTPTFADEPRGAGWISADAVAYVELARPSAILDRLTHEPVRGLLETSPDFQKALASDGYRHVRGIVDTIADSLGSTWDKALLDLVGGGVVLAVEPGEPPRAFLIATPRDPAFLARAVETILRLARADAASKGQPDPIKSAEHRGIRGYAVGPKVAYAIVDGTLVFADSAESMKAIIDRSIDNPDASKMLPADPLWQAQRQAQLGPDTAAWAFVRVDRLRQLKPEPWRSPRRPTRS